LDSKFSVELVDATGNLLADLSGRAGGRSITRSRNEADELTWSIDLNEFERYCRLLNVDPKTLIIPNSTEVRIKRGQKYLSGGQINYVRTTPHTISVRATGFLNLFKSRFTSNSYTAVDGSAIAEDLIIDTQVGTNRDFGVTTGAMATVGPHDRTYDRTNIKDALQNLTKVQTSPFDFDFSHDKVFTTYAQIGSVRPDIIFEYPGNIKDFSIPLDATELANSIIVLGSGFGTDAALSVTTDDLGSQANYKVREKVVMENSITESDTLTEHGNIELAKWSTPNEVPQIEVDGNMAPYITDYGIGDYVIVRFTGHRWLEHINTYYRVEKYTLTIDESDNESVSLWLSR
jgi:hypothetical protein